MQAPVRYRAMVLILYSLYLGLGFAYSLMIPMWQYADEISHYQNSLHYVTNGARPPRYLNQEADQPPTYYWLASFPLRLVQLVDANAIKIRHPAAVHSPIGLKYDWKQINYRFLVGPHVLRWLNVLLGVLSLHFIYLGARRFIPRPKEVAVAALALSALSPQFIFTNMLVSNDATANLAGAYLFYILSGLFDEEVDWRAVVFGGTSAIVLPLFVKLTVLPIAGVVLLRLLFLGFGASGRRRIITLCSTVATAALVWLAFQEFDSRTTKDLWRNFYWRATFVRPEISDSWQEVVLPLTRRYWRVFSRAEHGDVLSRLIVPALAGVGAALCLGSTLLKRFLKDRIPIRAIGSDRAWTAISLVVLISIGVVVKNALSSQWSHGHYLFPSIGALSLVMLGGWFFVLPSRCDRYVPGLVTLLMLGCNLLVIKNGVIPNYFS